MFLIKTIGITGYDGGVLKQLCDISVHIPIDNMQIAEDVQLILDHLAMTVLGKHLKLT